MNGAVRYFYFAAGKLTAKSGGPCRKQRASKLVCADPCYILAIDGRVDPEKFVEIATAQPKFVAKGYTVVRSHFCLLSFRGFGRVRE